MRTTKVVLTHEEVRLDTLEAGDVFRYECIDTALYALTDYRSEQGSLIAMQLDPDFGHIDTFTGVEMVEIIPQMEISL